MKTPSKKTNRNHRRTQQPPGDSTRLNVSTNFENVNEMRKNEGEKM